ncbi:MAG: PAS domain S-box protein, partial [Candidatus Thermoplasmatota archaeon]|nr:PAS domain S-box protein [Candidatus Thermoplasmatota archaeon]
MRSRPNIEFINGRKEYICPETSLPILELEEFTNVKFDGNYIFNIKKIGDSILYIKNRGDMANSNVKRYYELIERFIKAADVKESVVEIRDMSYLTGRTPVVQLTYQKNYLQTHQEGIAGFILCKAPLWLRTYASAGFKTYKTSTIFTTARNYSKAIHKALDILKKGKYSSKSQLCFDDIRFEPEWEYHNPETGFGVRSGVIPGKVFYSSFKGSINLSNARKGSKTLHALFNSGLLTNTSPIKIADYTGLDNASFSARKFYAKILNELNNRYNCKPNVTYICGADRKTKAMLKIAAFSVTQRFIFVSSVEEAFRRSQSETERTTGRSITVSQKEIDEINDLCGHILWANLGADVSEQIVSPDNPLHQLKDTLAVIREDISELRKNEEKQNKRLTNVFESLQTGLVIVDAETHNIVFSNNAAADMAQTTRENMIGKLCHKFICPAEIGKCPITDLGKSVGNVERTLLRADGSEIPVFKSVKSFVYQGRPCLLESFSDITEIKEGEERQTAYLKELQQNKRVLMSMMEDAETSHLEAISTHNKLIESEERLDMAMSVANDGIWDWNLKSNTILFDDRYYMMAGYEPKEFPSAFDQWEKRVHPEDLEKCREAIQKYISGEMPDYVIEFRFKRKDDTWMWIRGKGKVVERDEEEKPIRFVGTHSDITERKNAENALLLSEERLDMAMSAGNYGIWDWNLKSNTILFDDRYYMMAGYEPKEFPSALDQWEKRVHPEDLEKCKETIQKYISGEMPDYVIEFRFRRKDGTWMWILDKGKIVEQDEEGRPSRFVGIHSDITYQKEAEEKIVRLATMINQSSVTMVITDLDGKIEYANPYFEISTGYTVKEAMGQNPRILKSDQQDQTFYRDLWDTITAGRTWNGVFVNKRKDGVIYHEQATIFPVKDAQGHTINYAAVKRDITEEVIAKLSLQESETRYRDIAQTMGDWIWEVDSKGRYTYCSEKCEHILGYEPEEMVGKTPLDFMTPEEAERAGEAFTESVTNKAPINELINWNLTKDGNKVCLQTSGVPILDSDGKLIGYRGIDSDITKRKRAEEELKNSEKRM